MTRYVDVIEGREPRPRVSMFTLVFAGLQALYSTGRRYGAPLMLRGPARRALAEVQAARAEDEAFEDAVRLAAARRPFRLGDCWCGDPGAAVLPGVSRRVVCQSHYEVWRDA